MFHVVYVLIITIFIIDWIFSSLFLPAIIYCVSIFSELISSSKCSTTETRVCNKFFSTKIQRIRGRGNVLFEADLWWVLYPPTYPVSRKGNQGQQQSIFFCPAGTSILRAYSQLHLKSFPFTHFIWIPARTSAFLSESRWTRNEKLNYERVYLLGIFFFHPETVEGFLINLFMGFVNEYASSPECTRFFISIQFSVLIILNMG